MRYLYALRSEDLAHVQQLAKAENVGIEVRLDTFRRFPNLAALSQIACPILVTYRTQKHFGEGDPAVRQREGWKWRLELARLGVKWVDVEQDEPDLAAKIDQLHEHGAKVVLSQHLDAGHDEIERVFDQGMAHVCDAYKLIGVGHSASDFALQRKLYQRADKPFVMFWMGEDFAFSRVLSMVYGAPFTFVARPQGEAVAAGQLTREDLVQIYAEQAVPIQQMALYSVIGQPIGHSKSPAFHNPKLKAKNANALFGAFPAKSEADLRILLETFPEFRGTAVTKPMKEVAFEAATHFLDDGMASLGAANTLLFHSQTQIEAANTDYAAMRDLLREVSDGGTVRILGYGGLGKAVTQACLDLGLPVEVSNRNSERLNHLPAGVSAVAWEDRHRSGAAVIVQATSAGMVPKVDVSPLNQIPEGTRTLIETIYNPRKTKLMDMAQAAGCKVVDGLALFNLQAEIQNKLFANTLD